MKKGSALLIVLGMMGFIMVSALAFSAYMRYARLPSSYLRRTSSSRLLIKAALARAINDVDLAIGNNPHPGVGSVQNGSKHNTWRHRVFMGTSGGSEVSTGDTVTPLCFEALAYLPPPLVNEARYFSRRAPSAQWQPLGFDVGRYTYCAVDVSDYFDINRLMADKPRSSSPQRRVSLAYLFEDDRHRGPGSGGAAWDNFMDEYRTLDEDTLEVTFDGKYPLISLADFNLALGRKGSVGIFKSPFYEYLRNGGAGAGFYNTQSDDDENRINRMTFVTDGWFPADDKVDEEFLEEGEEQIKRYDLNNGQYQPFIPEFLAAERPALSDVVMGTRLNANGTMHWLDHLSGIGCAALYDYLDPDHVPISLAIPTTERVPMICGIQTVFPGSKLGFTQTYQPDGDDKYESVSGETKESRTVTKKVVYQIDTKQFLTGFGGSVKPLVTFPFSHHDEEDGTFSLDGRFSLFFTSEPMGLRTGEMNDILHLTTPVIGNSVFDSNTGVLNVKLTPTGVAFPGKIKSEEEAVKEIPGLKLVEGMRLGPDLARADAPFLTVTYQWTQTRDMNAGGVAVGGDWKPKTVQEALKAGRGQNGLTVTDVKVGMKVLKANGTIDDGFEAKVAEAIKKSEADGPRFYLNAAVWLRLLNKDGKIVDMVPACVLDDKFQNAVNDPVFTVGGGGNFVEKFSGKHFPLMRLDAGFNSDDSFKISIQKLDELTKTSAEVKFGPESMMVADPRYNYAPEHWFQVSGGEGGGALTSTAWLDACRRGKDDRAADIFMATSDAGYLQSPYEVAFLPRFTDLIEYERKECGWYYELEGLVRSRIPERFEDSVNQRMMWRTYDPFDIDQEGFERLPWTSEGSGLKINPYSDSTNILMAAFANTPIDWKRASTNSNAGAEDYASMSASDFNKKYAFNNYSTDTVFDWEDLERFAGRFMDEVRRDGGNWKRAWRELPWLDSDLDRFCGRELVGETEELWEADRKFLYGYWRDCFAAKQQLFLIFVRAEPMMMGSGAVGQIPPQLGARAVALVWRDPKKSKENGYPHQTRVLFYRQFE